MSLVNQNWIGLNGEPVTGRIPPRLLVMNGVQPNPQQMGMIAHHYKLLTYMMKVSVIPFLIQERTLTDGTRIRMVSSYGTDTVMVWPTGGSASVSMGSLFVVRAVRTWLAYDSIYGVDEGSRGWYKDAQVTQDQLDGTVYDSTDPQSPKLINGAVTLKIRTNEKTKKKEPVIVRRGGPVGLNMHGNWEGHIHYGTGVTLVGNHVFLGPDLCAEITGWVGDPILAVSRVGLTTLYVATQTGVMRWALPTDLVTGAPPKIGDKEYIKLKKESKPLPRVAINGTYIIDFKAIEPASTYIYKAQFGADGRFVAWLDGRIDPVTGYATISHLLSGVIGTDPITGDYILKDKSDIDMSSGETNTSNSSTTRPTLADVEVARQPPLPPEVYKIAGTWDAVFAADTEPMATISSTPTGEPLIGILVMYVNDPPSFSYGIESSAGTPPTYNILHPLSWTDTAGSGTYKNVKFSVMRGVGEIVRGSIPSARVGSSSTNGKLDLLENFLDRYTRTFSTSASITDNGAGEFLGVTVAEAMARYSSGTSEGPFAFIPTPLPYGFERRVTYSSRAGPIYKYTYLASRDPDVWDVMDVPTVIYTRYLHVEGEYLTGDPFGSAPYLQTSESGSAKTVIYANPDTGWMLVERGSHSNAAGGPVTATYALDVVKLRPGKEPSVFTVYEKTYTNDDAFADYAGGMVPGHLSPQAITGQGYQQTDSPISAISTKECIMFSMPVALHDSALYDPYGRLYGDKEYRSLSFAVCDDGTVTNLFDLIKVPEQLAQPGIGASGDPTVTFEMTLLREKI
jgi:hypothetical protein